MRRGMWLFSVAILAAALGTSAPCSGETATSPDTGVAVAMPASTEAAGIYWGEGYIEAFGQAVPPTGTAGTAQGQLLARRGAIVDLQRSLLEFVEGVRVDAKTTMKDFMANDEVRTSVSGSIKGIVLVGASWEDDIYTVRGRLPLGDVRKALAKGLQGLESRKLPVYRGKGYSRLVVDARNLPVKPALALSVLDEKGREVHGIRFADKNSFVDRGLCRYTDTPDTSPISGLPLPAAWLEEYFFARAADAATGDNPLYVRAVALSGQQGTDIVISNSDADVIRNNAYDFRIPCQITVITSTTSIRGEGVHSGTLVAFLPAWR